jgi:hypothetical protein
MEDNLDSVRAPVEQLDSPDLIQDRIVRIVGHIVGHDWRQGVSFERKYSSFEKDLVFR